jgi:hypothetical protein
MNYLHLLASMLEGDKTEIGQKKGKYVRKPVNNGFRSQKLAQFWGEEASTMF